MTPTERAALHRGLDSFTPEEARRALGREEKWLLNGGIAVGGFG